ncbi:hypothetical protein PAL_GLEAN10017820 [Pteropus alecto]|uniref:Uncharacterized protein n=1 Tax=Pteropus alecto TaxID=9402 RepID=L5KYM4_PTEAL|nr:hypothetical protein PAL_GLEAN10017820 [Pteropus alecto]
MDGTGNGENNDKSVSTETCSTKPPACHSISCSLAPQPSGSEIRKSTRAPLVVAAPSHLGTSQSSSGDHGLRSPPRANMRANHPLLSSAPTPSRAGDRH